MYLYTFHQNAPVLYRLDDLKKLKAGLRVLYVRGRFQFSDLKIKSSHIQEVSSKIRKACFSSSALDKSYANHIRIIEELDLLKTAILEVIAEEGNLGGEYREERKKRYLIGDLDDDELQGFDYLLQLEAEAEVLSLCLEDLEEDLEVSKTEREGNWPLRTGFVKEFARAA